MIVEYSFIIAVIPVILVVAFLVWIAKKITDGERIDMKEGIVGVVILMVAVLVMVPMVSSTQVYTWDEDNGELVIQKNIFGGSYAWDTYDDQIRSIVIKPGVTQIGNSAFDGATNLEYLSIPESVTDIGTNAFGVTFKNHMNSTISVEPGSEYVGNGSGTLYLCDESVFTYSNDSISGLSSSAQGAVILVLPNTHGSTTVTSVNTQAFKDNTTITKVFTLPKSTITTIRGSAFSGCTNLAEVHLPDRLTTILGSAFGASGITEAIFPDTLATIGGYVFQGCTSLSTIHFPSSLQSADVASFGGTTGVTEISFAAGFNPTTMNYGPWTFYESDGTTQIEKTAANLAGKTFQGTASALVEVSPGLLSLTPQQIQQVHLHDTELQDLKDQISIEPLPLQPSLQEQELTA